MSDDDAWLDAILIDDERYIEDRGFSDAVMSGLPITKEKISPWFESVVILVATLVSLVLVIWVVPGFDELVMTVIQSLRNNSLAFNGGIVLALLSALTGFACVIGNSEV